MRPNGIQKSGPGTRAFQDGIPITFQGKVIGAIGVSSETPTIDEAIASAGSTVAQTFKAKVCSSDGS